MVRSKLSRAESHWEEFGTSELAGWSWSSLVVLLHTQLLWFRTSASTPWQMAFNWKCSQAVHWKAQVVKISDFGVVHFLKKFIWLCGGLVAAHGILVTMCEIFCCSVKTGIEPRPPALGAWNLTHWTTREVPRIVQLRALNPCFCLSALTVCSILPRISSRFLLCQIWIYRWRLRNSSLD